ncbi:MAG: hypothetical protein H6733_12835 [Alphaproteobacteria bacterium]|nr:hypothetical protein [Alphaproteobacteria bacterium]
MNTGLEAGVGPKQIARMAQWTLGIPIVYSFSVALLGLPLYDPFVDVVGMLVGTEWRARWVLGAIAALIEISDMAIVKGEEEYENRIHELIKGIGDRLRAGSAVETAVSEACRQTDGPSVVFERAIELSDAMPFDAALREAADTCGSDYLREVCYLVAEAVSSEGDTGGAIRRLGMELERNHMYMTTVIAKISSPVLVMRIVGLFAVPPLYALLRFSSNNMSGVHSTEQGAQIFFMYGAVGITVFDGLIFGQWERLFARLPLAVAAVYIGLNWIG